MTGQTVDWDTVDASMRRRVHNVTRSVLRDEHEAEDAVQDTFLRAFQGLHTLRDPGAFSGWLLTLARNAALNRFRKRRRTPQVAEPEPDTLLDTRELGAAGAIDVAEAFARLTPSLQRAVNQHLRGLTLAQAAAEEGISVSAAKMRLWRARDRIKAQVLS